MRTRRFSVIFSQNQWRVINRKSIVLGKKTLNVILIFSILFINLARVSPIAKAGPPTQEPPPGDFEIHVVEEAKQEAVTSASSTSALASGGPDSWGYLYEDSNDTLNGPTYEWIEISGNSTALPLSDDSYARLNLPFSLYFYGMPFSAISIGSNGVVYFKDSYLGFSNTSIPGPTQYPVEAFIAVFWDDLNPSAGGTVYYAAQGEPGSRRLIIEWRDVPRYGASGGLSFEIILFEGSGEIIIQYQDVLANSSAYDYGRDATVGIQANTSLGLQYSYNSSSLSNGLALRFRPPACAPFAAAIAGQKNVFLPLVMKSPSPYSFETTADACNTTDTNGRVTFYDNVSNGQVEVTVKNQSGVPLQNIDLFFYSNGNSVWVLVMDPRGIYFPQMIRRDYPGAAATGTQLLDDFGKPLGNREGQIRPQVAILPIVVILAAGAYGIHHLYELSQDPPRIELEEGSALACLTAEEFRHIIFLGGAVVAFHHVAAEFTVHAALWAAGELGFEELLANPLWENYGHDWPWAGENCFWITEIGGKPYIVVAPEGVDPDTFFQVEVKWDKNDSDVDLHVYDSRGNHAYYANKQSIPNGFLDRDDVDGFGPEVYTQLRRDPDVSYIVKIHYYSDHHNGPTNIRVRWRIGFTERDWSSATGTLSNGQWWTITTIRPGDL